MEVFKITRIVFIYYGLKNGDRWHYILTLKGFFWKNTKTKLMNCIDDSCRELVEKNDAVIMNIKIVK